MTITFCTDCTKGNMNIEVLSKGGALSGNTTV